MRAAALLLVIASGCSADALGVAAPPGVDAAQDSAADVAEASPPLDSSTPDANETAPPVDSSPPAPDTGHDAVADVGPEVAPDTWTPPPDTCAATTPSYAFAYSNGCQPIAAGASHCGSSTCTSAYGYRCPGGGRPTFPSGIDPSDGCAALQVGGVPSSEFCCPIDVCVRSTDVVCNGSAHGWLCRDSAGAPGGSCTAVAGVGGLSGFCCL
jgi:hypothetical protein